MSQDEITRRDESLNRDLRPRLPFGRGSKIKRKYLNDTLTLLDYRNKFWTAVNARGTLENITETQIGQVFVNGAWIEFNFPREWTRQW